MGSTATERFIARLKERDYDFPAVYDRGQAVAFVDDLFHFLVTPQKGADAEGQLAETLKTLRSKALSLLVDLIGDEDAARRVGEAFFERLPEIYEVLLKDAEATVAFDPAAESIEEVLAAYPGFYATVVYRFAHAFYHEGVPLLPRVLTEHAHSKTGIDIHPGAEIGSSFFIDHGTGIVIGQSTVIGEGVKIYQGVTLGALSTAKGRAHTKRHPTIGNNVIIYAGATILGGNTTVGDNSIVGGNVWLTHSVGPDSIVYHQSSIVVKGQEPIPEPLNFII